MKRIAEHLKIGDVIMPPPREVQLWMRCDAEKRGLPESALYMTITSIEEAAPDKSGRWLLIAADQSASWNEGRPQRFPFKFKVRPATPWQVQS